MTKEQHPIGKVINLPDGRKVEVVENKEELCLGCIWDEVDCFGVLYRGIRGLCSKRNRTDHKNIIYKEIKEE